MVVGMGFTESTVEAVEVSVPNKHRKPAHGGGTSIDGQGALLDSELLCR